MRTEPPDEFPAPYGARTVLAAAGCAAMAFGLWQILLASPRATRPLSAAGWLVGVLVVHDGLLAPIAVGVGVVLVRVVPTVVRRVVAAGLFVAFCLVVITVPALLTPGVAGNPSATPRDYGRGLVAAVLVDLVLTAVVAVVVARRTARAAT